MASGTCSPQSSPRPSGGGEEKLEGGNLKAERGRFRAKGAEDAKGWKRNLKDET